MSFWGIANVFKVALWRLDTACGYTVLPGHIQQLSSSIHLVSSHLDTIVADAICTAST